MQPMPRTGARSRRPRIRGEAMQPLSAWQVGDEAWPCDSGVSTHMTLSADCVTVYR